LNRKVSDRPGTSYAPALFAKEDEAIKAGLGNKNLAAAMRELFKAEKIWNEPYGRPSRPSYRIMIKDGGARVKIVSPTRCELIALDLPLAPMAPAMRPAARDLKAYTLNAAPTPCPPWRTPAYKKAVWPRLGWCTVVYVDVRWVYGRCTL
jgi:hypothetical protein